MSALCCEREKTDLPLSLGTGIFVSSIFAVFFVFPLLLFFLLLWGVIGAAGTGDFEFDNLGLDVFSFDFVLDFGFTFDVQSYWSVRFRVRC